MATPSDPRSGLTFHPVTPDRWADLERLFGPRGANSGCWCMWWRTDHAEFNRQTADEHRAGLKHRVDAGRPPGILAYAGSEGAPPVAWISLGPREEFAPLEHSRTLKRIDDRPVWAIVCFFVARPYRRKGLMAQLLRGAVAYAAGQGARIVEGYPVEPEKPLLDSGGSAFMGLASAFRKAGFVEVAQPSEHRRIMRFYVA